MKKARIYSKLAVVRSGPGPEFYATQVLATGDAVEIVGEQGDWLAIRPPSDSFCWVDADKVDWQPGRQRAVVRQDDTPAWIGSSLMAVSDHVYHVELRSGDEVTVVESKRTRTDENASDASKDWLKILPPAGDVRWIERKTVDRSEWHDKSGSNTDRAEPNEQGSPAALGFDANSAPDSPEAQPPTSSWFPRWANRRLIDAEPHRNAADEPRPRGSSGDVLSDPHWTAGTFEDRVTWLHIQLSKAAATQADAWVVQQLETAASRLVQEAATSSARHRAEQLRARAEDLHRWARSRSEREQSLASLPETSGERVSGRAPRADPAAAMYESRSPSVDSAPPSPYVAEGWLMPVASLQRNAPPFVVTDADGQPLAFVTPAPGLNLRPYVDRRVGVIGQRTFAVFDRPHVIAHRIVQLHEKQ